MPSIDALLPGRVRVNPSLPDWMRASNTELRDGDPVRDLEHHLRRQLLDTSLPVLLRYEDRNSMAWSVESRVPFLDYRLVEFLAGVPDRMKLASGTTKLVFREAMRGVLPEPVRARTDKMGFVTPEEVWLTRTATDWFRSGVEQAIDAAPELLNGDRALAMVNDMAAGVRSFTFDPWRILCYGRWLTNIASGSERPGVVLAAADD
jgi:asparagine synthase (glutamine-hydrolysing)